MTVYSKALWATALVASATALSSPAVAATGSGSGRAIIVTPTSFFMVEDMDFGTIVPGSTTGSVTIDETSGNRTAGGGAILAGTAAQRARFIGGGQEGETITLTLSAPPVLDDGAGHTMPVTALVLDGPAVRTIDATTVFDIYIGGTLAVGANQEPGNYSGTFTLSVDYS
jgi:hypothetical protein